MSETDTSDNTENTQDNDGDNGGGQEQETRPEPRRRVVRRATSTEETTADPDGNALLQEFGLTPAQARRMLKQAPVWETRAKENYEAAQQKQTVEQQLEELRKQITQRDIADVERAGRLAMTQVRTRLAEAGIRGEDADGLLDLVDGTNLLTDGEPDGKAIDKLATSLTKIAGRASPDPDQGRKGGSAPPDMNTLIRRAAGVRTS